MPLILQLIVQHGPVQAILHPTGAHPHDADWALRAKRAHYNAVGNLVVFAPLVLIVVLTGAGNAVTATAAAAHFFLRAAHCLVHLAAVAVIRTVEFLGGWACQLVLGLAALGLAQVRFENARGRPDRTARSISVQKPYCATEAR